MQGPQRRFQWSACVSQVFDHNASDHLDILDSGQLW